MQEKYWVFRVDNSYLPELNNELEQGRLRQGWGFDKGQDLRKLTVDKGASRNQRMFDEVKKGDRVLVPHLPNWNTVTIAEATEDWDTGYCFEIFQLTKDHGHIFPAKPIGGFTRHNEHVKGGIRSTLRTPSRFWNINYHSDEVEEILVAGPWCLNAQDRQDRLQMNIQKFFGGTTFKKDLSKKLNAQFEGSGWEHVLVDVFNALYPQGTAERVGGRSESQHGTDILIKIPGLTPDSSYCIAVQVKDYKDVTGEYILEQIKKAEYWNQKNQKLIEKVVVLIGSKREDNKLLAQAAEDGKIKVLYESDVDDLLFRYACMKIGSTEESLI